LWWKNRKIEISFFLSIQKRQRDETDLKDEFVKNQYQGQKVHLFRVSLSFLAEAHPSGRGAH
jgi:hypothetical protein